MTLFTKEKIEQLRAQLPPEKLALLEKRLRGEDAAPARPARGEDAETIPRRGEGEAPGLSYAQQRLWFLERLSPGTAVFNVPSAVRLLGALDLAVLERCLGEIVRRHESLRSRIEEDEEGRAVVRVDPGATYRLGVEDAGGYDAALARAREDATTPFDLARGPLFRARLLRLGDDDHLLVANLHHAVSDAFSMGVLFREVAALYRAFAAGDPSPLPPLPIQYPDFARWQREQLRGEKLETRLAWWRERLAGVPAVTELPTDRPRPSIRSFEGGQHRFVLAEGVVRRLKELGARHDASLFMTLLTVFNVLLHRLGGQDDLVVGFPVANRDRPETEGLIGFFVNTLVLRTDASGDPALTELLGRVRRVALDAYSHQDVPFEKLVEELHPERHLSHNPLFQVAFQLLNEPPAHWELAGLRLSEVSLEAGTAQFDLTLNLVEVGGEGDVTAWFEYSRTLFDATTVARMARQLALLAAAAPDDGCPISRLPLLGAAERWQIVHEWNDTRGPFSADATLDELFLRRAAEAPDALALVFAPPGEPRRELRYGELRDGVLRLAALLRRRGVRRGGHVGIYLRRSPEMVEAVLAVLAAGGAYVPLDRRWPAERLRFILDSLKIRVLLADTSTLKAALDLRWRVDGLRDVVCLGVGTEAPPAEGLDAETVRGLFDHVAAKAGDWIAAGGFKSASTGEPMSAAEVHEYRDRVVSLVEPWLGPESRVLEVGCGSGVPLRALAPRTARYVGLDPSPRTLADLRSGLDAEWAGRVELVEGFAHEIDRLLGEGEAFDVVLLASTVQFFPGPLYLEEVLRSALARLAPGGAVVLADVPDARRRPAGGRADSALALDEDFFRDLGDARVEHREGWRHDNELRWRYDVVLRPAARERRKRLWTSWHAAREEPCEPAGTAAEDLAYVIFTSGSTGEPKGVAVRHRPAVNLVEWVHRGFDVGPADRLLFTASLAFDLSVYDIFGTLAAGASLHVAGDDELVAPERLVEVLRRGGVTFWDSAPAALQQLVPLFEDLDPADPGARDLRLVFLSGDWIPVRLPDQVRAAFPGARVVALGGATEATVWSNVFPVGEVDPGWPSVPYGRPITNARYYALDRRLMPCPVGVAGDLMIGGDVLLSVYAGDPRQSAWKVLPDPHAREAGARMYRTGDRVRFFADGVLEFLGRVDSQVKVHGYRIELGEIDATLGRHPGVEQAVTLVREEGGRRLVSYVVPSGEVGEASLLDALRERLAARLPEYMVPGTILLLDALPLSANGKLDRAALPVPSSAEEAGHVEPRSATERLLAGIWSEVLGRGKVGVTANFFELGGDSILSVQIISRARKAGLVLEPRDLFRFQTVAELARHADAQEPEEVAAAAGFDLDVGELRRRTGRPVADAYPLSPFQELQLAQYLDRDEPGLFLINLDFVIRGFPIDPDLFRAAWQKVVDRHAVLRTSFLWEDVAEPLQLVHETATVPVRVLDWREQPPEQRRRSLQALFDEEIRFGLPLAEAPHTRVALARTGEMETTFVWTINLMLQDGWSFPILLTDLFRFYDALSAGGEPDLGPPAPYRDFVDLARRLDLDEAEAFWRRELAGFRRPTPLTGLFAGRFEPGEPREVVKQGRDLGLEAKAALREVTADRKLTLYTLAAGAWALLLSRYTGDLDVVFGIWVSARSTELDEVEKRVGNFLNFLPLRVAVDPEKPLLAWLGEIQDRLLEMRRFDATPPPRIREWSEVPEGLPLYESYLVFESFPLDESLRERAEVWDMEFVYNDVGRTGVPLRVEVHPTEGLLLLMQYYREHFDAAIIERATDGFAGLLAAFAADPERPVKTFLDTVPEPIEP